MSEVITIKTDEEIQLMREAGKILAQVHETLAKEIHEGMSTLDVDRLGEEVIRSYGCEPNFKGLYGYPASVCVSVNDEVVHGIPTDVHILVNGDIVSLDTGVLYKGYHSDAARTVGVGEISEEARLLIERTRQSFFQGMKFATAGNHLYDISGAYRRHIHPRCAPCVSWGECLDRETHFWDNIVRQFYVLRWTNEKDSCSLNRIIRTSFNCRMR